MSRVPLTPRQATVHRKLVEIIERTGVSPTVAELAEEIGSVPGNTHRLLRGLVERGWVKHNPHYARSYYPVRENRLFYSPGQKLLVVSVDRDEARRVGWLPEDAALDEIPLDLPGVVSLEDEGSIFDIEKRSEEDDADED